MEEQELLIILYDYYGELFSDNQKDYFEWYYFDNLSLSEIAENVDKSRNAIHKCIKGVCSKLSEYENMSANGWDRIWDVGNKVFIAE